MPELILTLTATEIEPLNSRALIIFAKNPLPGAVKTRLSPPLTPAEAAGLYSCMIQDSVEIARSLFRISPFIFFQNDPGAADYFKTLAPEIISTPQKGANLGEKMKNAFDQIFLRGFAQVAIIGTDSPDLPPEHIMKAFTMLENEHTDVVFGPAEDGGYYLLAIKKVWGELFSGLPWSSDGLLAASVARTKDLCLGTSFLPVWYDIDTEADLKRPELLNERSTAINTLAFLISRHQPDSRHSSDR
jgi:rSAM/selenodomain-associated transferase 1